jgi:Acyl-CoA dehydrogenase N terminal
VNSGVLSRRDLDFLLFEWLRVDELTKRQRFADHTTETFADVLTAEPRLLVRTVAG